MTEGCPARPSCDWVGVRLFVCATCVSVGEIAPAQNGAALNKPLARNSSRLALLFVSAVLGFGCGADQAASGSSGGSPPTGGAGGSVVGVGGSGGDRSAGTGSGATAGIGNAGAAGSGETATPADVGTFQCPSGAGLLADGMNQGFVVSGASRSAIIDLPQDTSKPAALLFSWFGYGDNAVRWRESVGFDPDFDPEVPMIVVTPESTGLQPPAGLSWDISNQEAPAPNVDVEFFGALLGCLVSQYDVDATRIYSFGFSAGSVMTALLASTYPDLFAATVNMSGAWFNDPEEVKLVRVFTWIDWNWPPLEPQAGNVLLTHGGPSDVTVLNILDLEESARAAVPFLTTNGRTVVDCAHDSGHALDPDISSADITRYLHAHRHGLPSPYLGYGDAALPHLPEHCRLVTP